MNTPETHFFYYTDSLQVKHKIEFIPYQYKNLMELLWDNSYEDWGDCKGRAWCGTCQIKIKHQKFPLPVEDKDELNTLLNQSNKSECSRLACQITPNKNIDSIDIEYLGDS